MYSFSHEPTFGWLGDFQNAQQALIAGRARYANADKIFVAKWQPANYSDFLPSLDVLISMMRETVSERLGDEAADIYDELPARMRHELGEALVNAVAEWEAGLPGQYAFTGRLVSQVVGYERLDEVRKKDFS